MSCQPAPFSDHFLPVEGHCKSLWRKQNHSSDWKYTLQGTNKSHLGKRKIIFKSAFERRYVSFQQGTYSKDVGHMSLSPSRKTIYLSGVRSALLHPHEKKKVIASGVQKRLDVRNKWIKYTLICSLHIKHANQMHMQKYVAKKHHLHIYAHTIHVRHMFHVHLIGLYPSKWTLWVYRRGVNSTIISQMAVQQKS